MMHTLLGLAFLGAALKLSRRAESFGGMGTIPPPPRFRPSTPAQSNDELEEWVHRTFAPGTPVASKEEIEVYCGDGLSILPIGSKCVVYHVGGGGEVDQTVYLTCDRIVEGFFSSETKSCERSEFGWKMDERYRPLVDNWGPLTVPSKKSYKAGWTPKPTRYKGRP